MNVQHGVSLEADFEKNTWTFEMLGDYQVGAGNYAIIPESSIGALAAAHDLLAVAREYEEVLNEIGACECGEPECRTTRLRAAIAKATGGAE